MENILSHDKDDNYIDDDESDADFLVPTWALLDEDNITQRDRKRGRKLVTGATVE